MKHFTYEIKLCMAVCICPKLGVLYEMNLKVVCMDQMTLFFYKYRPHGSISELSNRKGCIALSARYETHLKILLKHFYVLSSQKIRQFVQ